MNKKLQKFLRNPKLFFQDMYFKRRLQLGRMLPIKYEGKSQYTIVTAIYNVEPYLDDFFKSLVNQSLSFKKNIQIICVDDGSTDCSAEIIKKWQKKYPENIHYFHKENGGQSSARNFGLRHVKTEWVTFIDPDDYLNPDYFKNVDIETAKHQHTKMLVCNLIFFMEAEKIYKDTHPLKYRFKERVSVCDINDWKGNINLSVASSFFKTDIIHQENLHFDHRIKPNFEDGKFIADYLCNQKSGKVLFLKDSHYLYRKRSNNSSSLDNAWRKTGKFDNVLHYGYLAMLQDYRKKQGAIPAHIQRTVLYDMVWYINYLLDQEGKTAFLTENQKNRFHRLISNIFEFIDIPTIMSLNLAGAWWLHKAIMIAGLKGEALPRYYGYVENIDREKEQIYLYFYTETEKPLERIIVNDKDVLPVSDKVLRKIFVGKTVLFERRLWISYQDLAAGKLEIFINGKAVHITLKGKVSASLSREDIQTAFKPSEKYRNTRDAWIIMDRDMQADDNAEHFYRYLLQNHPKQKAYFALSRQSHDWQRLSDEGFRLLDYGSEHFEKTLRSASKIISSHADEYVENHFNDHYEFTKKFVFLQHGITQNNLSQWLNKKKSLRCIIAATYPEYEAFTGNRFPYKFNERDVVLTGFPRHDSLLKGNLSDSKTILIMPTWRSYIVGNITGKGFGRSLNERFTDTVYYRHWHSFLNSPKLKKLAEDYGYQVVFAPHANIEPYLPVFDLPEFIQVWKASNGKIQHLFQSSSFMITDYSSVAFEMAYLGKTVLYYQFDKELVFSGGHTTQTGYYSYENDGFGAVVYDENNLLAELENTLQAGGIAVQPYLDRINNTFPFRDGKNCERVYQAIKALDEPEKAPLNINVLRTALQTAYQHQAWPLVENRASLMLQYGSESEQQRAWDMKTRALFEQGKFEQLTECLKTAINPKKYRYWQTEMAIATHDWQTVVAVLEQQDDLSAAEILTLNRAYIYLGDTTKQKALPSEVLSGTEKLMIQLWENEAAQNWQAIANSAESVAAWSTADLKQYKPQLLLAQSFRRLNDFKQAHQQLLAFEKHSFGNIDCRLEIAHLAYAQGNFSKTVSQLDRVLPSGMVKMPECTLYEYWDSLQKTGKQEPADLVLKQAKQRFPDSILFPTPGA